MKSTEFRSVHPPRSIDADIQAPPSKSYTNRALIAAALADGRSEIYNPSQSDDTKYLITALTRFGTKINENKEVTEIIGLNGLISSPGGELFAGNAGTTTRFLASLSALAPSRTTLRGDSRMNERPMKHLIDALSLAGIECESRGGFLPLTIRGGTLRGGTINVNCEISSQFLSSLLLIAPYAPEPMTLQTTGKIPSSPYIGMTIRTMEAFGAVVTRPSSDLFMVDNSRKYSGTDYKIEGDASSAGYFCAAAAITGGRVRLTNLGSSSLQGDIKFIDILSAMGCAVEKNNNTIEVRGNKLRGLEADMKDMPDSVPMLAVTAAFAEGRTLIRNIRNLRYKESDRISAIEHGLSRLGCGVEAGEDYIIITPKPLHGAEIETFGDHRIVMCFAVAGLKLKNISIQNPECVTKSYPDFWAEIKRLESR